MLVGLVLSCRFDSLVEKNLRNRFVYLKRASMLSAEAFIRGDIWNVTNTVTHIHVAYTLIELETDE